MSLRIAMVHVPFGHRKFSENLKVVDEEFILAPPLVLAYVAAIVERAGHDVCIVEAHGRKLTRGQAAREIMAFGADVIAFRADVYGFQEQVAWMRHLRRATGLPVIAGGIAVTDYPRDVMTHACIDYGLMGEAVGRLPRLLRALEAGEEPRDVDGVLYRRPGGELVVNPCEGDFARFDDYPYPARHLLPNAIYRSFVSQRRNFTLMLTATGCPYHCVYCAIVPLKFRQRSPESVVDEMQHCVRDHGVREIDFFDATFFANRDRAMRILDLMGRRGLDVEWTCRSRVDLVDDDLLRAARRAGCRMIYYGIESGSPRILNNVRKNIDTEQVREAIRVTRRQGIRSLGFLMVGNPGETRETIRQTVRFARSLKLDYAQICRTIAKPQTDLDRQLKAHTGLDYWAEFIRGERGDERLPMPWVEMPQDQLEEELKRAYFTFYFRPGYMLRTLRQARSLDEIRRYVKVGFRMVGNYFYSDIEKMPD